ncbi:MAG: Periplasmic serine endoprotease DegP [Alphaproteobacteria bacterium MarineAlpha5_Bin5]|nr:MAG: Periplasmic serine endoprotease DegP [Alphaproteobacteria bacterium MarineAlpha5_Bin5]PPR52050.1 MAG: Periplasmic serine endoprotease DegP [Alphaproteobacteria bacterium MarineAlpha5_Bin4]|tara:strand:+ start:1142 stop:2533 length:1392 start_codon:yes stop_codon:yes gene_type:complete
MKKLSYFFSFIFLLLITQSLNAIPNSFADLVEKLSPSVVSIASTTIITNNNNQNQIPRFPEGSPFDEFFKDFFDNEQRRSPSQRPMTGLGSGFIIDDSGIVVTNNHVIEGADEITVILSDQQEFTAELLGRDPKADLAVLKINSGKTKLQSVSWGDSDRMRVGDWSIAIGNPLGLGGTVTTGIISAISRDIGSGPYVKFLQTDASINRGNSGGPLFNVEGEVIGINSAIISQTGGSIGLGFAIPSNSAKKIVKQLIDFGRTKRGWLGVQIQPVSQDFAESLGLPDQKGAFVSNVNPNGPSNEAGIKAGDVILKFNNIDIEKMIDLPRVVAESDVGSIATVELWRKNKLIEIKVKLGELPEERFMNSKNSNTKKTIQDITIETLGLSIVPTDNNNGVIVTDIKAENSNIKIGDIITEVNMEKVNDPNSFKLIVEKFQKTGRSSLLLKVNRNDDMLWVTIQYLDN